MVMLTTRGNQDRPQQAALRRNMLLMDKAGGYTLAGREIRQLEGWYWGAYACWGTRARSHLEASNSLKNVTGKYQNC